jgi:hypothetical protein
VVIDAIIAIDNNTFFIIFMLIRILLPAKLRKVESKTKKNLFFFCRNGVSSQLFVAKLRKVESKTKKNLSFFCNSLVFSYLCVPMKICVFCSANQQIDPDFFAKTEELGIWAANKAHTIVYGGVNQGLMECLAKASKEAGGHTIGVVPMIVEKAGRTSDYVDVEIPCDNLSDRKQLMEVQSDVFIALPGGIGTLDEIFTIAASATIGYHQKPVILYNMKGFWDSLILLLDDLQARGVIRGTWRNYVNVATSIEEIITILEKIKTK